MSGVGMPFDPDLVSALNDWSHGVDPALAATAENILIDERAQPAQIDAFNSAWRFFKAMTPNDHRFAEAVKRYQETQCLATTVMDPPWIFQNAAAALHLRDVSNDDMLFRLSDADWFFKVASAAPRPLGRMSDPQRFEDVRFALRFWTAKGGDPHKKNIARDFLEDFLEAWNKGFLNYRRTYGEQVFAGFIKDLPSSVQEDHDAWRDGGVAESLRDRLGLGHIPKDVKDLPVTVVVSRLKVEKVRAAANARFRRGTLGDALAAPTCFDAADWPWFHPSPKDWSPPSPEAASVGRAMDLRLPPPAGDAPLRETLYVPCALNLDDLLGLAEIHIKATGVDKIPELRQQHCARLQALTGRTDYPTRVAC